MNRRLLGRALPIGCVIGLVFAFGPRASSQRVVAQGRVPSFEVDASWPRMTGNWLFGSIGGMTVEAANDHIWVLQRPSSVGDDENFAARSPALSDCCVPAPPVMEFDAAGKYIGGWGGPGSGYDWPESEHGISIDAPDSVWIVGNGPQDQVLKFTRTGRFLLGIGQRGKSSGSNDTAHFNRPTKAVGFLKAHEVFVADGDINRRVIVFDAITGAYKRHWGAYGRQPDDSTPRTRVFDGPAPQQFNLLHDLVISNDDLVYISDRQNSRIQVFNPDGTFVKEAFVERSEVRTPHGSVIDMAFSPDSKQEFLYVTGGDQHVRILDRRSLQVVGMFGRLGYYPGQFRNLRAIAVDSKGNIYTGEDDGRRIQKFVLKGITQRGRPGWRTLRRFKVMKSVIPVALSAVLVVVQGVLAQQIESVRSPEVLSDRRVTFRVAAQKASSAAVVCECVLGGKHTAMRKDDRGVWSVTIGPLEPDIYEYYFTVDGVDNLDQRNPVVKYNHRPNLIGSILEVPGDAPMFYDVRPVPHGTVSMRYYQSKAIGGTRRMFVYAPPGYDRSESRYPVLYLLHGAGGDETVWTNYGRVNHIIDNLIADGKVAPMVIVMPFGFAYPWYVGASPEKQRVDFEKDLLGDVVPFVEANYRVYTDREHRALAGLSMGGGQTLAIGPRHLDLFSRLAVFSAGAGSDPAAALSDVGANAKNVNAQLKLFWLGIGTGDPGFANAKKTSDFLTATGIDHTFYTIQDAEHTFIVWRRFLLEVAPKLWPAR